MSLQYLTLQQWRRRPARTLLTILSVSISVTYLMGTLLAQSTVRNAYREVTRAVEGPPSLEIVATGGERFAANTLPDLNGIRGIREAIPLVSRATGARVRGKRLQTLVVGLESNAGAGAWKRLLVTSGRTCEAPNEVVMVDSVAASLEVEVGARVTFLSRRGPRSATVVGLVDSQSLRNLLPNATLAMQSATVQQWFGVEGQIDLVRVFLESDRDNKPVQRAIEERLPEGLTAQLPVGRMVMADNVLNSAELALTFAGVLSLFMAGFLIFNTLRMNFSERRKQLATLRALGATRGQVATLVVWEALWIGILGTLLGIPGGILLASFLAKAMQGLLEVELPASTPRWEVVVVTLACAPLISLVASLVPVFQSRRISAIDEMGEVDPKEVRFWQFVALVFATVTGFGAAVLLNLVITERISPYASAPAFLLLLLTCTALLPLVVRPLVKASILVLAPVWGIAGRLAAEQLLRRPGRTGMTAGVLVIAITGCLGLGNAILNTVDDLHAWYRRSLSGDFLLQGAVSRDTEASGETSNDDSLLTELSQLDGVGEIVTFRMLSGRAMNAPALCMVRDFPASADLPWTKGAPSSAFARRDGVDAAELRSRLAEGEVVLGSVLAKQLNLSAGDSVRIELQGRVVSLRIGAIVADYHQGGMVVFLDRQAAAQSFSLGPTLAYMVQRKENAELESLESGLQILARERNLIVQSFAGMRRGLDQLVNGVVVSLWGLLLIGFLVGAFAVANTLTMSVLEQTRELGLLRIVGMTRGQIRRLVFFEAWLIGTVGLLVGTAVGVGMALIIHACMKPLLGYDVPFVFHYWLLAANAVGCMLATLVSAWLPIQRVSRLDVLQAIAYE